MVDSSLSIILNSTQPSFPDKVDLSLEYLHHISVGDPIQLENYAYSFVWNFFPTGDCSSINYRSGTGIFMSVILPCFSMLQGPRLICKRQKKSEDIINL